MPVTRFVYLTMPQNETVVLNVNTGDTHVRYQINRDQLFLLNKQIVEILVRNRFDHEDQLVLDLEKAATL
jgi:hypothetical protein